MFPLGVRITTPTVGRRMLPAALLGVALRHRQQRVAARDVEPLARIVAQLLVAQRMRRLEANSNAAREHDDCDCAPDMNALDAGQLAAQALSCSAGLRTTRHALLGIAVARVERQALLGIDDRHAHERARRAMVGAPLLLRRPLALAAVVNSPWHGPSPRYAGRSRSC